MTPDTALRLARYFGTSAEFWIGLQATYDLEVARDQVGLRIETEIHPRVGEVTRRNRRPDRRLPPHNRRDRVATFPCAGAPD